MQRVAAVQSCSFRAGPGRTYAPSARIERQAPPLCRKTPVMNQRRSVCGRAGLWLASSGLLLAVGCGEGDGEPLNPNGTIGGPSPVAQPTLAPTAPSTAPVQPTSSTPAPGASAPVTPAGNGSLSPLGSGVMGNSGTSTDRWKKADVTRDGHNYYFMANGWGPGF